MQKEYHTGILMNLLAHTDGVVGTEELNDLLKLSELNSKGKLIREKQYLEHCSHF